MLFCFPMVFLKMADRTKIISYANGMKRYASGRGHLSRSSPLGILNTNTLPRAVDVTTPTQETGSVAHLFYLPSVVSVSELSLTRALSSQCQFALSNESAASYTEQGVDFFAWWNHKALFRMAAISYDGRVALLPPSSSSFLRFLNAVWWGKWF